MDDLFNVFLVVGVIAVIYFSVFRDSNKNSNSKVKNPMKELYGEAFGRFRNEYIDTRPQSDLLKSVLVSSFTEAIHTCYDGIDYDYRIPKDDYDAEVKMLFVMGAGNLLLKARDRFRKGAIITDEERYKNELLINFCYDLIQDSFKSGNVDPRYIMCHFEYAGLIENAKEIGCNLDPERLEV